MIIFLTLLYVAALAIAVWLRVIRLNLWWKLSPLVWGLFLLVILFIPMQWGAPTGRVLVYRPVVEIVPNVGGEVIAVEAIGMTATKKGETLFQIDPSTYQMEVDRLTAALKQAEQTAAALPEKLKAAQAALAQAEAALVDARQQSQALEAEVDLANASLVKAQADAKLVAVELERRRTLVASSPRTVTKEEIQELEAKQVTADAAVTETQAKLRQAELARDARVGEENTAVVSAQEGIKSAEAAKREAEIALAATVDGENAEVAQLKAQLAKAAYELDQTTVRAPSDGYPVGVSLRPGDRVANLPMRSWMAFVRDEEPQVGVGIPQYAMRHVEPGQKAEVIFKAYPGETFSATVKRIGYMTSEGQVTPGGAVPLAPDQSAKALPYGVLLELDALPEGRFLPGGAVGTAAIYTDRAAPTHIIRKTMLRMESWMNYVLP